MKRTTIIGITNESFVYPAEVKEKLLATRRQAERDVLAHADAFEECDCPACGASARTPAFTRDGFNFQSCDACATLYLSPRPTAALLLDYYHNSDYGVFLASGVYGTATEEFRRSQARKRADKLIVLQQKVQDVGDAMLLYAPKTRVLETILDEDGMGGVETLLPPWDRADGPHAVGGYAVISAFDIFERVPDIRAELKMLSNKLADGGRIILSMRSGSGYDLLTLWQDADISPLEHMNLVTVEGVEKLLAEAGFGVSELSTPGQLDLQIVDRVRRKKDLRLDRFTEYFLDHRDAFAHEQFQQFLQKSLLSSHMLVVGVKQ